MNPVLRRFSRAVALVASFALALGGGISSQQSTSAAASGFAVTPVGELNVGAGHSFPTFGTNYVEFRDRLFFWADDGSGFAIWSYDGVTFAKPSIDPSLPAGVPGVPNVQSFAIYDDKLYFTGNKSGGFERELFVFDGTSVNLAYDFEDFANPSSSGLSNGDVASLRATPHGLFMSATGQLSGEALARTRALWRWDGAEMHFVAAPGGTSSNTLNLAWHYDRLYFSADGPLGSSRPWVYDPTQPVSAGTLNSTTNPADLGIIGNQSAHFVSDFGALGGKIYFGSNGNDDLGAAVGRELWVYDPTLPIQAAASAPAVRNPELASDINVGSNSSLPEQFFAAQGHLFFRAQLSSSDRRLHRIDSSGNVVSLQALNSGAPIVVRAVLNDQVVFTSSSTPLQVFTYDVDADTFELGEDGFTQLFAAPGTSLHGFVAFKNQLYWVADLGEGEGRELYRFGAASSLATIDPNPLIFAAAPSQSAVYSGPVLERFNPNPARVGETLEITGLRLDQVSRLEIDGTELEILETAATSLTAKLPLTLTPGVKNVVAHSSAGKLTVQDALELTAATLSTQPRFYTKKNPGSESLNFYARDIVGAGKVRFVLNGREVAWVRAIDASDPKLNVGPAAARDGLVRTVGVGSRWSLVDGRNVLEIWVGETRLVRRIFTQ